MAALPPHPHLVGQYRAWQQGGHFYIQMELCQGGSLAHLLSAVRTGHRSSQVSPPAALGRPVNQFQAQHPPSLIAAPYRLNLVCYAVHFECPLTTLLLQMLFMVSRP